MAGEDVWFFRYEGEVPPTGPSADVNPEDRYSYISSEY
jgi:hypothetical protein